MIVSDSFAWGNKRRVEQHARDTCFARSTTSPCASFAMATTSPGLLLPLQSTCPLQEGEAALVTPSKGHVLLLSPEEGVTSKKHKKAIAGRRRSSSRKLVLCNGNNKPGHLKSSIWWPLQQSAKKKLRVP